MEPPDTMPQPNETSRTDLPASSVVYEDALTTVYVVTKDEKTKDSKEILLRPSVVYDDAITTIYVVPKDDKEILPRPSVVYKDAIESPVYRLSELMFGSLLAAYVLGFIGFAAVYSLPTKDPSSGEALFLWHLVLFRAPFFFISITYAYVTAGFYVAYHAGIMTMHHMPLKNLRFDFALALSQALLFGIAMLHPMIFPALLGLTLILTVFRQLQEHNSLVESFFNALHPAKTTEEVRTQEDRLQLFRRKFSDLLKADRFSLLSGWKAVPKMLLLYALILMGFSAASKLLVSLGIEKTYVLCLVSLLTCSIVVISVHRTLGKRASLLYKKMAAMDTQFTVLLKEL